MELKHKLNFIIESDKFEFRCLNPNDVSDAYIEGLKNENKYLVNNEKEISKKMQQDYIKKITDSESSVICGLFLNSILLGTAGIQNLSNKQKTTVGIFIFNKDQRLRGFGKTLVWSSTYLIKKSSGIDYICANMKKSNIPSLKSFLSCGYQIINRNKSEYWVALESKDLIKPKFIIRCDLVLIQG